MAKTGFLQFVSDYGMVFVLLLLMVVLSFATIDRQQAVGKAAGVAVAKTVNRRASGTNVFLVTPAGNLDQDFVAGFKETLSQNHVLIGVAQGGPREAKLGLQNAKAQGKNVELIVCTPAAARWDPIIDSGIEIAQPQSYFWPNFLMPDNLVTIAQRITIIAIIAIGMTMVILTGGIDLSVGSLIALSAVVAGVLIRDCFGGKDATAVGLCVSVFAAIAVCGAAGFFTGFLVAGFRLPPFIVSLAMMLLVRGVANVISNQRTIHEIPTSFDILGKGYLFGIPYSVWLMFGLFALAYLVMTHTTLGRQIYAVGGNEEAARLSGIPVKRVLLIVYTVCGLLSGLGGVIVCSQLRSAKASYGNMDELTVIAAVVVGGTSLLGGQGKILGTLIGAFIIGVIQNGMNLVGMDDKTQMIVLGAVIVLAVLLDRLKKGQVKWSDLRQVFSG